MAEQELMSIKYLQPDGEASSPGDASAIDKSPSTSTSPVAAWARASRWISAVAGVALLAGLIGLAIPYVKKAASTKANSPVDWLVRTFTGRSSNQVVEQWIRDRDEANQRQWDEMYRNSPVYQLEQAKPIDWHFELPANSK